MKLFLILYSENIKDESNEHFDDKVSQKKWIGL